MEAAVTVEKEEMHQVVTVETLVMVLKEEPVEKVATVAKGSTARAPLNAFGCDASGGDADSGDATGGQGLDCAAPGGGGSNCQVNGGAGGASTATQNGGQTNTGGQGLNCGAVTACDASGSGSGGAGGSSGPATGGAGGSFRSRSRRSRWASQVQQLVDQLMAEPEQQVVQLKESTVGLSQVVPA